MGPFLNSDGNRSCIIIILAIGLIAGIPGCSGNGSDHKPGDTARSMTPHDTVRQGEDTSGGESSEVFRISTPDGQITAICTGEEIEKDSAGKPILDRFRGKLYFKFADDTMTYTAISGSEGHGSCADSSIFSPSGKWVRLQPSPSGPFELIAVGHLKDYLAGRIKADHVVRVRDTIEVVKGERTPMARTHDSFRWEGDTAFVFAVWNGPPVYYRHTIGGSTVQIPAPPPGSR